MYDYLQQKSNEKLEALFDKNLYDESELLELKIAVNVPYQNSRSTFERCDGEIEINGTIYKYVKRKLSNDTLYLMCLKNSKKMDLETAKNDFFKLSNDLKQNNKSNKSDQSHSYFKNMQPVFNDCAFGMKINSPFIFCNNFWLPEENKSLSSALHLSPEQPPDLHPSNLHNLYC